MANDLDKLSVEDLAGHLLALIGAEYAYGTRAIILTVVETDDNSIDVSGDRVSHSSLWPEESEHTAEDLLLFIASAHGTATLLQVAKQAACCEHHANQYLPWLVQTLVSSDGSSVDKIDLSENGTKH